MILILGAMDEEIQDYISYLQNKHDNAFYLGTYYTGVLFGKEVIISKVGIGKTLSAITTQFFIDKYEIEYVIFTGIAGSLDNNLEIGDIVIGQDLVFYDFDTRAFGDELGLIPRTGLRFVSSDELLLNILQNSGLKFKKGLIGTADKFVSSSDEKKAILKDFPSMLAVEMEGCSVALTCKIQNIPFLISRVISDKANGKAPKNFNDFLIQACKSNFDVIKSILEKLNF